jgi:shikimate kinase
MMMHEMMHGWAASEQHVVLVGLPGAGKSTVGRAAAERLGRPFLDLDVEIEAQTGRTIGEIFREDGEEEFRRLERGITAWSIATPPAVIASGGGWMMQTETVELLRPFALLVYLRVTPERALRRLGPGVANRPLLRGSDPMAALTALAAARDPVYRTADRVIDTEVLDLKEVIDSLVHMASDGAL